MAFLHDGFSYDNPGANLHVSQGRLSRHSCTYRLSLKGEDLGELRFLRGRKFVERELALLETLLAAMVYPLRNALLYRQAVQASQTDPLTGVHNRKALDHLLTRELASFERGGEPVAVLVLDLDHFKRINDTLGHSVGDRVLKAVSGCLVEATRACDMVFRTGGEEFVILMRVAHQEDGVLAAERIRAAVEGCAAVQDAAPGQQVSASIGVAPARYGSGAVRPGRQGDVRGEEGGTQPGRSCGLRTSRPEAAPTAPANHASFLGAASGLVGARALANLFPFETVDRPHERALNPLVQIDEPRARTNQLLSVFLLRIADLGRAADPLPLGQTQGLDCNDVERRKRAILGQLHPESAE